MKKPYVKPEIQVISFTLSEAIAASSCVAQVYNHAENSCEKLPPFNAIDFDFGATDVPVCSTPIDGYCYSTSGNMVFSS